MTSSTILQYAIGGRFRAVVFDRVKNIYFFDFVCMQMVSFAKKLKHDPARLVYIVP